MDLTPAAFAAQARELVQSCIMRVTLEALRAARPYQPTDVLMRLPEVIAAALGAVCDAARAERAEEVRQLREALRELVSQVGKTGRWHADENGPTLRAACAAATAYLATTEPSHG